jgi:hypothetical protein
MSASSALHQQQCVPLAQKGMLENALHFFGPITVSTGHKFGIDFMIYLPWSMYALVDITDLRFLTVNHYGMLLTKCICEHLMLICSWIPKLIIIVHMLMYSKISVSYFACHFASCKTICILLIWSSLNMYVVVSCHFDTHFMIRIS